MVTSFRTSLAAPMAFVLAVAAVLALLAAALSAPPAGATTERLFLTGTGTSPNFALSKTAVNPEVPLPLTADVATTFVSVGIWSWTVQAAEGSVDYQFEFNVPVTNAAQTESVVTLAKRRDGTTTSLGSSTTSSSTSLTALSATVSGAGFEPGDEVLVILQIKKSGGSNGDRTVTVTLGDDAWLEIPTAFTPVAAPGAPTIDSVTAGDGQLSVAFTAGSDGGSAITNYEYSTDDGAAWTARSPVSVSSPLVISGLDNGTTYQVMIRAVNAVGVGAGSNMVAGTPAPVVPGAPSITGVTAGDGQLSVAFTAGSDGGSAITNYEYSTDDGATWTARSPVSVSSPLVISGLDNGTTYQVRIRAVNAVGVGAESDAASGIPVATPGVPSIGSVTAGDGQLSVAFTAGSDGGSAITNYEYSTDDGATWTARSPVSVSSPLVISGLVNGTTYQVRIRAVNAVGVGAESDAASGIPVATPGVPSIGSVTAGDGQLSVAFTAGSDGGSAITNYEYSTDDGATWTARSPVSVSRVRS
jgi:hypothetical protein